jgi:hypothetical protein
MKIKLLTLLLVFVPISLLSAAPTLSGNYKGTIAYTPYQGVTTYRDGAATMKIVPDTGSGAAAIITYSDQLGRYREKCSVTYNADGTVSLKGISYKLISGDSFNLDTFTVRIGPDGSVTGTSVDSGGGSSTLSFHH